MPIDYKEYPADWKQIVARIKERDHHRCKFCHVKNYFIGVRQKNGWIRPLSRCGTEWEWVKGHMHKGCTLKQALKILGFTQIILTVAHLDHDKTNNENSNLAALCQRC